MNRNMHASILHTLHLTEKMHSLMESKKSYIWKRNPSAYLIYSNAALYEKVPKPSIKLF